MSSMYKIISSSYHCPWLCCSVSVFFFFQAEDGIRDLTVTGVQTCALPIFGRQCIAAVLATVRLVRHHPLSEQSGERLVEAEMAGCLHRPSKEPAVQKVQRSEERRVGKECRSRWSPDH